VSQALLQKEKQSYFQALTVYEELKDMVYDFQISNTEKGTTEEFGLRCDPQVYPLIGCVFYQ